MDILAHYLDSDPEEIHKEIVCEFNEVVRERIQEAFQTFLNAEFLSVIEDLKTKGETVQRNGSYGRDFMTTSGKIHLSIPRDRFSLYQTTFLSTKEKTGGSGDILSV